MLDWLIKRVILRRINNLLNNHKGNVEKIRATLLVWTERIKKVLACFESLLAKIEDNELDANELKTTGDEVGTLIKEW